MVSYHGLFLLVFSLFMQEAAGQSRGSGRYQGGDIDEAAFDFLLVLLGGPIEAVDCWM